MLILREVVETASDESNHLPTMLTPSPAPTATPSPTPDSNALPTINPNATEGNWYYPTADDDKNGNALESLPEDAWAES